MYKLLSLISLIIGALCHFGYRVVDPQVAANGQLVEAFYFLPLSYLFTFIGVVGLIGAFVYDKKKAKRKDDKHSNQ